MSILSTVDISLYRLYRVSLTPVIVIDESWY